MSVSEHASNVLRIRVARAATQFWVEQAFGFKAIFVIWNLSKEEEGAVKHLMLTSMGRGEEETGENRQILGVKKVSFAVLSLAQASEKTRFQGIRQGESLDAVAM